MSIARHPHAHAAASGNQAGGLPSLHSTSADTPVEPAAAGDVVSTIIHDLHANILLDPSDTAAAFNFKKHEMLGSGAFGKVWVCEVCHGALAAKIAPYRCPHSARRPSSHKHSLQMPTSTLVTNAMYTPVSACANEKGHAWGWRRVVRRRVAAPRC